MCEKVTIGTMVLPNN